MKRLAIVALGALLAGCAASSRGVTLKRATGRGPVPMMSTAGGGPAAANDGNVVRHQIPVVILLDVYQLAVPSRAISQNDEFWKRVDETRVDVGIHDLLDKNGIRIGLGRDLDWRYFKGLLGKYPSSRMSQGRTPPGKEGYVELPMRTGVAEQTIFGLDDQGQVWGRSFERCDDLLGVSFIASTHHPGDVIVKVCPIVRGLRRYYRVSAITNEETQIELVHPEHLYNMRLEAVIPLNDFLIVAPSKQARLSTSMGQTFLMIEGKAEPVERVLVIVPRAFRTDDPTTAE